MTTMQEFREKYPTHGRTTECALAEVPAGAGVLLIERNEFARVLERASPGAAESLTVRVLVERIEGGNQVSHSEELDGNIRVKVLDLNEN